MLHVRLLWLKGKQLPESHLRFSSPPALLAVPPAPSWGSLQQRGLPSVPPAPLCGTLPRRSRWTGAIARLFTTTWSAVPEDLAFLLCLFFFVRYRRLLRCFGVLQYHYVVQLVDSCVDTHAPLSVRPALLAGHRVSYTLTVTRYFPSRVLMTLVSVLSCMWASSRF